MKKILAFILVMISAFALHAQNKGVIKGTIKDAVTGETIIGASILVAEGKGVASDLNGNFSIEVDSGQYTVTVSYVGYTTQKLNVKVSNATVSLNVALETKTLDEVEIVSDVARSRETPIAFSNVGSVQMQEELGTRDIPMILNSTPGAYATEQGGGSGDARINVRGFDQRNVAVMVDGVPVNDMETGAVFWSNWAGLGDITRTVQVQRGLGASKLAIPSVGGTINIMTKGIDQKMSGYVKQEVTSYGLYKTSFGFNSGQLKGRWGFTAGGSRMVGNEWADATFTDAWSYFGKVQKRFKNQLFSLSASGAPQKHGQRTLQVPVAVYSKKLADDAGVKTDSVYHTMSTLGQRYTNASEAERGPRYNPDWGILNGKKFNDKVNYFHKPQINLSHFWSPGERLEVSTVAYLSIGKGGGTAMKVAPPRDTITGQETLQPIYDNNQKSFSGNSKTEHASSDYLRSANNDHIWYGILSSWNYKISKSFSALLGIDGRYYKGTHYQSVYDLMGGDYALDNGDLNQKPVYQDTAATLKRVGDKVGYYNVNTVKWGGAFGQIEFKKDKWSAFVTSSISETGYQRVDYFKKKDLVLPDTLMEQAVGAIDTVVYKGVKYTNQSKEARFATTKELWFLGYTVKGGANYNITDHHNVFLNAGYLNMAPRMNAVFDNNNRKFLDIQNQKVYAVEAGYGLKNRQFAGNVNLYYTLWKNKPPQYTPTYLDITTGRTYSYQINGLDALHKGVEFDFIYKIIPTLQAEGLASFGDWKTISSDTVHIMDDTGKELTKLYFSAKNVHVGDAAQIQVGLALKYTIIKNLYIKPRFTYFGKQYANFDPILLTATYDKYGNVLLDNRNRDSWRMPDYFLIDVFAGYDIKYKKIKVTFTAGITNLANTVYISDGTNGFNFDAATALVHVGAGTRVNGGLKIGF